MDKPDNEPCPYCEGKGKVEPKGGPMWEDQCDDCQGTGLRSRVLTGRDEHHTGGSR